MENNTSTIGTVSVDLNLNSDLNIDIEDLSKVGNDHDNIYE